MKKLLLIGVWFVMAVIGFSSSEKVVIKGDHGKLSAVIQRPNGKTSYPIVIISHGFTSNKDTDLMKSLADKLEQKGIASIRFDFNGHGESEGKFQDMTVLNEIEDLKNVYNYVSKLKGVTSVSMVGHSQGGVVTSMAAGQLGTDKVKAIVLMAPAAVLRDDALRGQLMGKTYNAANPPEYVELSRGPEGHDNGFRVGRNYIKTAQTLPIYETAGQYRGHAAIIHGTGDVVVPYTYGERYAYLYPNSELHLIPGFDHGFSQDISKVNQIVADYFEKQLLK